MGHGICGEDSTDVNLSSPPATPARSDSSYLSSAISIGTPEWYSNSLQKDHDVNGRDESVSRLPSPSPPQHVSGTLGGLVGGPFATEGEKSLKRSSSPELLSKTLEEARKARDGTTTLKRKSEEAQRESGSRNVKRKSEELIAEPIGEPSPASAHEKRHIIRNSQSVSDEPEHSPTLENRELERNSNGACVDTEPASVSENSNTTRTAKENNDEPILELAPVPQNRATKRRKLSDAANIPTNKDTPEAKSPQAATAATELETTTERDTPTSPPALNTPTEDTPSGPDIPIPDAATVPGRTHQSSPKDDTPTSANSGANVPEIEAPTPIIKSTSRAKSSRTRRKPATPAPTPLITRPSRTRNAPERLAEQAPAQVKKAQGSRARGSKVFDPTYITTNSNSRLAKPTTNVFHMLLEPAAWDSLAPQAQAELIGMLPPTEANKALLREMESDAEPKRVERPKELLICDLFRTDVAKYQEDLRNGYLAKRWQASAHQAMKDRAAGKFDEWKDMEMEAWWGQKSEFKR